MIDKSWWQPNNNQEIPVPPDMGHRGNEWFQRERVLERVVEHALQRALEQGDQQYAQQPGGSGEASTMIPLQKKMGQLHMSTGNRNGNLCDWVWNWTRHDLLDCDRNGHFFRNSNRDWNIHAAFNNSG